MTPCHSGAAARVCAYCATRWDAPTPPEGVPVSVSSTGPWEAVSVDVGRPYGAVPNKEWNR